MGINAEYMGPAEVCLHSGWFPVRDHRLAQASKFSYADGVRH